MRRLTIGFALLGLTAAFGVWAQTTTIKGSNASRGLYTEDQANRGKIEYKRNCSGCHMENLRGGGTAPALSGDDFIHHYYSVGDLYSKVSMSMPANNVHGLSSETYVNIVAYLLQANSLPAGKDTIPRDTNLMKKMMLREIRSARPLSKTEISGAERLDHYYTEEQAQRGKAYFQGSCSLCHTTGSTPQDMKPAPDRGLWMGDQRMYFRLGGDLSRWHNAANLFDKMHTTMPAYDYGGLSSQEYVDILAYVLQVSGFPAGKEELTADRNVMKDMNLDKGFTNLFNGTDLTGMKFMVGNNCAPRPEGCGQTEPGTTFRVDDGTIYCSGKPQGYMYTEKKYLNFTLRLDYRFKPFPDTESDELFYGNSGYLLFITKNQVWPKMIEIQGMNSSVLSVIPVDTNVKSTTDSEARKRAIKPLGQWNSIEIVSKDGQVKSYLNGTLVSTITEHEFKEPGYIGFQSEGAEISWRDIRIREE